MIATREKLDWKKLQRDHLPGFDPYATADDGDWFDESAADRVVDFFAEMLHLFEGVEGGNQPFVLEPWQAAIMGALYGWRRTESVRVKDGEFVHKHTRRFREVFAYIPRKNGKTPLLAGAMLFSAFCDREPGAQLYSAAAEKEQAALIYRHATGMIVRESELERRATIHKTFKSIEFPESSSIYKALSADAETKHGLNSHFVAIDELHAHKKRDLTDVLATSTGTRTQPITFYITTADFDRESICNEKHEYACKVRDGIIDDHAMLPVIYEAGADDDWTDPKVWAAANPNLGISLNAEWMARECKRAQDQPTYENTFKRLHLNIKTQQDIRWISLAKWDECGGALDLESLAGQVCFAGIDLANKQDVAACVLFFPESRAVLPFFWVPEMMAAEREKHGRVPYLTWARQGLIETTPGDVIDHGFIKKRLLELKSKFNIQRIAYDPWHATQFAQQLQDDEGFEMESFRQGSISMNEPCREMERMIIAKDIAHGDNPVLRWMASNVSVRIDSNDLIRPDKKNSNDKIDGIVSLIMSIGLSMNGEIDTIYDKRSRDGDDELITFV